MLAQIEMLDAVERLGGWAVVVWIVVWLTRRWEQRMSDQVTALQDMTKNLFRIDDQARERDRETKVLLEEVLKTLQEKREAS